MDPLPHLHAVSALQDHAADLIRDAGDAPVGITRYGQLVAVLISPDDLATFQELQRAAERAFWTLDAERAARDVANGDVEDWDAVVARLRESLDRDAPPRSSVRPAAKSRARAPQGGSSRAPREESARAAAKPGARAPREGTAKVPVKSGGRVASKSAARR